MKSLSTYVPATSVWLMCGSYWECCRSLESACHLLFCCTPVVTTPSLVAVVCTCLTTCVSVVLFGAGRRKILAVSGGYRYLVARTMAARRHPNPRISTVSEPQHALGEPNHMPPEIEETLAELLVVFGRSSGRSDPDLFFDPHSDEPVPRARGAERNVGATWRTQWFARGR